MHYAGIQSFDVNNGEGVGCSLFVQGCHFHCKNCFNKETWDFNGGGEWTEEVENHFLDLVNRPYIKRVSFLGGEPLAEENIETVSEIMKKIPLDRKVWVFTGYKFEDLMKREDAKYVLQKADVIVDGRFEEKKKDVTLAFRGSTNQRLIDVKETMKEGKIKLWNSKSQSSLA